jgi:hypothetical protein
MLQWSKGEEMKMSRGLFAAAVGALLAAPAGALDWERITINGYTSVEYERRIDDEGKGDANGSFDSDGFDIVFNFQATDNVRAACDLTWEHGAATEDGRGNVGVEYAFIEYAFSDLLKVRAGKMFTPFGIFNEIHTAKPAFLTVKEAASINKTERIVKGSAYRFFPRWGTGIQITGDGAFGERRWDYNVMISNGEQEETNPFEEDDNSQKALTGRMRCDLNDEVRVGVSAYTESIDSGDLVRISSGGLLLEWEHGNFQLWSEAAFGRLRHDGGYEQDQIGFYVQPSWRFENGVTPYMRFDWIDPDRDADGDEGHDLIVGVNWEPQRWFMVKLENNWFKGGRNTNLAEFSGRDYNEVKAALVLGW